VARPVRKRRVASDVPHRVATRANKRFIADTHHNFAARREARLDTLADLIEEHLDTSALMSQISEPRTTLASLLLSRQ